MKKIIFLLLTLSACNNDVKLQPQDILASSSSTEVDYNMFLVAPASMLLNTNSVTYTAPITLYLRPYAGILPTDTVVCEFKSSHLSRLIFKKDTLYYGDKFALQYADFKAYTFSAVYESGIAGTHDISISTAVKKINKSFSTKIITR
jgi:hypothetical protein